MSFESKSQGFTLIELMIVVAIIAIIATIAIPAYQDYVIRAKRTDAKTAISQVQLAEEKWRANNTTYGSLTNLGFADPYITDYYSLTVTGTSATAYTITATPQGSQATQDTECANFIIDQDNNKTISGTGTATTCWQK